MTDYVGGIVMGGIFFLSGIFACMAGVHIVQRSRRIRREGLPATATVVGNRYVDQRHRSSGGEATTRRYYVAVQWRGADGADLRAEWSTVHARLYEALPVGATAQILYLPPKPGQASPQFELENEPAEHRYATGCWIWAVISLGAGGAALVWGFCGLVK